MDGYSQAPKDDRIKTLQMLMPEVFDEGRIDWEKLKATLGEDINFANERYVLNWAGKSDAFRTLQQPSSATLSPCKAESVDFDNTQNIFIEGENMEVLKILQKSYFGKIKMIYIDPPYNTGNDSFIYPDKFSETKEDYLRRVGDKDEDGYMTREGLFRKNSRENGQYHSNWLSMMMPRLYLARNLMRDDGVIFVSIDDNEVHNLRMLMNEVFGEENFVASIVWQKKYAATNDSKGFSTTHDYIIVYQKSELFNRNLLPRTGEQNQPYKNDDKDGKGLWRSDNLLVKSFSESGVYPIINPNTNKEYYPPKGSCWRASKETMKQWLSENRIFFGKDGKGAPQLKRYLNEVQQGRVPITWWNFEEVGHNDEANKEVSALFQSKTPFDTPKPTRLLNRILQIGSDKDSIILDFFAGSATTAHAVMQLNKEDGGNRKYICVQLPELCDEKSEAYKAGYKTIADIAKERIRRAGKKIKAEVEAEQAKQN
ncbi:MAG: site-specific DNA-methyltransferase, partial [Bacteroidales bacterium]|nr:site-specific DNA-methyltransferase [Bacteroidales bacterium]